MATIPATHRLFRRIEGETVLGVSYSQIELFQQCPYRWYRQYVEGEKVDEKTEALAYGSTIHQMLETFFKGHCMYDAAGISSLFNYYEAMEAIPFDSIESMIECGRDAVDFIAWLSDLFKRDLKGFIRQDAELSSMEKLLRRGTLVEAEEPFVLPYKLPKGIDINGERFERVHITGSIDLHKVYAGSHYILDWKTGRKMFSDEKLETNLQFPIYSFYVLRKYGKLPRKCFYFFTRNQEYQMVDVDEARVRMSVSIMNDVFGKMYDFETKPVGHFYLYKEKEVRGVKKYVKVKAEPDEPMAENMKPCPSALCHWCPFGPAKRQSCVYASDWEPSKKKENGNGRIPDAKGDT